MACGGSIEAVAISTFAVRAVDKLREVGFTVGEPTNDVCQLSIPIKRDEKKLNLHFYPSGFKPRRIKEELDEIIIRQVRLLVVMASLVDALFQTSNEDILKQIKQTPSHMVWFNSIEHYENVGMRINGICKFTHKCIYDTLIPVETGENEFTWDFTGFAEKLFYQPVVGHVDSEGCETPPATPRIARRLTSAPGLSRNFTTELGRQISTESQMNFMPKEITFDEAAQPFEIELSDSE
jgi:hypothetical protein